MLIKTKDLTGSALDWAVALAIGRNIVLIEDGEYGEWDENDPISYDPLPKYSSDWASTGLLIEEYGVQLNPLNGSDYSAKVWEGGITHRGCSALTAACRSIVGAELGEEVDVPDDLIEGGD